MTTFYTNFGKKKTTFNSCFDYKFQAAVFLHEGEGVAGVEVGNVGMDHDGDQAGRGQRFSLHRSESGTGDC
jgi:hypothetical protein